MLAFFNTSWWVVLALVLSGGIYMQASRTKDVEIKQLKFQMSELLKEKALAKKEREELLGKIESQNDPAWIELVLMKELGVVPDGYIKVYFQKPKLKSPCSARER